MLGNRSLKFFLTKYNHDFSESTTMDSTTMLMEMTSESDNLLSEMLRLFLMEYGIISL